MKKILLSAFLITALGTISNAQCNKDKKITFTSSKTEYLDASNTVQDTKDEKTVMEINNNDITLVMNEQEDQKLTGTIKSSACDWKVPFKEGKSVIKATLSDPRGDTKNVTITIEGKDGKVTFLGEIEEMADKKIR